MQPYKLDLTIVQITIYHITFKLVHLQCLYMSIVQNKCTRYWPEAEDSKVYGHLHVMNLKEITNPHYILREFLVHHDSSDDTEGRNIYQFHFKAWPDHGVPHDPGTVLGFLNDVTLRQSGLASEGRSPGPIVVHCSAGIGRTGTFIVIDILINLITYQGIRHHWHSASCP